MFYLLIYGAYTCYLIPGHLLLFKITFIEVTLIYDTIYFRDIGSCLYKGMLSPHLLTKHQSSFNLVHWAPSLLYSCLSTCLSTRPAVESSVLWRTSFTFRLMYTGSVINPREGWAKESLVGAFIAFSIDRKEKKHYWKVT